MPENLICPHCAGTVGVPDHLLGGKITCPYCRGVFLAAIPLSPEPPPAPNSPFGFDGPTEGEDATPRRASRPAPVLDSSTVFVVLVLAVIAVGVVLFAKDILPRPRPGGFDYRKAVIGGVVAAVAAVAAAIGNYRRSQRDRGRGRNRRK
jgi:hypothetical protein